MSGMDKLSEAGPTDRAVSRSNLSRRWCREPGTLPVHLRLSFVSSVDISSRSAHVWAFRSFGQVHRSYKSGPFLLPGRCCWGLRGSRFTGVERERRGRGREGGQALRGYASSPAVSSHPFPAWASTFNLAGKLHRFY